MKTGELISTGGIYADINALNFPVDEDGLRLETETVGSQYVFELGGSAVNFARLCGALEIPTTFIGKVGKDELGRIVGNLLTEANVKPALVESEDVSTNVSFNMVTTEGKSIMAVVGTANQSLTPKEVYSRATELLPQSPYLYIGGCFKLKKLMPAFIKLAEDAKAVGTKVVLDHGRLNDSLSEEDKETVRHLALSADTYLPSEDEFMQLWGVNSVEEGLTQLAQQTQGTVIVKMGREGAKTIIDDRVVSIESFQVTPIHTIGAGDSFNAGFIAAQYKGLGLAESIQFACATGALKISQTTLPNYQQISNLIERSK